MGTDHSEMKIVASRSQSRMVTVYCVTGFLKTRPALQRLLTVNSPGCLAGKIAQHSSVWGKCLRWWQRKRRIINISVCVISKRRPVALSCYFLCRFSQWDLCRSLTLQGKSVTKLTDTGPRLNHRFGYMDSVKNIPATYLLVLLKPKLRTYSQIKRSDWPNCTLQQTYQGVKGLWWHN